jgi:hypothetical protein
LAAIMGHLQASSYNKTKSKINACFPIPLLSLKLSKYISDGNRP